MSYTRKPGSGRLQQTSRREDHHIVRNACVQTTASSATIQAQIPHGERLNPSFDLQRHTAPTPGMMVWDSIAYNTRSLIVLIRCTMAVHWYIHDILQPLALSLMQWLPGAIFSTGECSASHNKCVTRLSPHCYYRFLVKMIPRFVANQAYQESFGIARWSPHEFERTRVQVYS
ncbi:transposable element Tcb2 transposase [Trichonephila clavipes]|nr:transposable element Tcb2 transposase [Trichonephila clavipes]